MTTNATPRTPDRLMGAANPCQRLEPDRIKPARSSIALMTAIEQWRMVMQGKKTHEQFQRTLERKSDLPKPGEAQQNPEQSPSRLPQDKDARESEFAVSEKGNGILWRFRTGSPWADIPERYSLETVLKLGHAQRTVAA